MPSAASVKRHSSGKLKDTAQLDQVCIMEKVDVNGKDAHPVFEFLRYNSSLYDEQKNKITPIPWNFGKFLVDSNGSVVKYYGPKTAPMAILPDIKELLENPSKPGPITRSPTLT